jgi:N-acetylglucosaminyl-diphospho-decaprenol L-rhamnosyltransferase
MREASFHAALTVAPMGEFGNPSSPRAKPGEAFVRANSERMRLARRQSTVEKRATSAPVVSVTTVLFNSSATVESFAEPLREPVANGFAEVIAIDNASPDDSSARLRKALPGVQIVTAPRNLGFAGGCNLAWPRVRGRYWLLLNPDVKASAGGIRALADWMDAKPGVAIGSPMLESEDGKPVIVARAFPKIRWRIGEMFRLHKLMSAQRRSERLMGPYWNGQPNEIDWVPFAAAMIRRDAVEKLGPLSEEPFMYGEDMEWCWRAARAGWLVAICMSVRFVHTGGASAAASWTDAEIDDRLVSGTATALRIMHGRAWTRLFAAVMALHLYLESVDPRRDSARRSVNRAGARVWFRQAAGKASE